MEFHVTQNGKEVGNDHPLVRLLNQPSPNLSFQDWIEVIDSDIASKGQSMLWVIPNQIGVPISILVMVAFAIPEPPTKDSPYGSYRYCEPYQSEIRIPAERVIRIWNRDSIEPELNRALCADGMKITIDWSDMGNK